MARFYAQPRTVAMCGGFSRSCALRADTPKAIRLSPLRSPVGSTDVPKRQRTLIGLSKFED
jgi:hypothetical protein